MRPEDILIVNDGSPFLKTIGLILADKGYRTCVTDSPLEALGELSRKYFRLVIVKLQGKTADSPALLNAVKDLNPEATLIILGEDAHLPSWSILSIALPRLRVDNDVSLDSPPPNLTGTPRRESVSLPSSLESFSLPRMFKEAP